MSFILFPSSVVHALQNIVLVTVSLFFFFCSITSLVSQGCGKYCLSAFVNSLGEITAPDSSLNTAFTKFFFACSNTCLSHDCIKLGREEPTNSTQLPDDSYFLAIASIAFSDSDIRTQYP